MKQEVVDKFLKRKSEGDDPPSLQNDKIIDEENLSSKQRHVELVEVTPKDFPPLDPALRPKISDYHPDERDEVRRFYLQNGPCQPCNHKFPPRNFGKEYRRFNPAWFSEYSDWLEYSVTKDAAYCLYCYLFKLHVGNQGGGDVFVSGGFKNWKKKERFNVHVGGPTSIHNKARHNCETLMNQIALSKQSDQAQFEYQVHLTGSIECIRFLLLQGLALCGHDDIEESNALGNFLMLLRFLARNNPIYSTILKNAPDNLKLIAPSIQKDIMCAAASETTDVIIKDLGDEFFAILVDEGRDLSIKEQMVVILRYVDRKGNVLERFLGIVHVSDTGALSLKVALESLFSKHGLSISRLRGQGYNGASDMKREFNGLKTLMLRENETAYYVHCFAHQLQSTLVHVAKNHISIGSFFNLVASVINVVGGSCKCVDILRESQVAKLAEALKIGEVRSGRGVNQELSLKRAGDTYCGFHYSTLVNLFSLFSFLGQVLEIIVDDGLSPEQRSAAATLLDSVYCFDFAFNLHLMKTLLGITNELSQSLQRKDQDIVNSMSLVEVSKRQLLMLRDEGWESLLSEVGCFCTKHSIVVLNMGDVFVVQGWSLRRVEQVTNLHHYRVDLFYSVIDMQLQELNSCFTEVSMELLLCVACLNPRDAFSAFDKSKLIRLAQFYPSDFSPIELLLLDNQLQTYVIDMRTCKELCELKGIGDLAKKLVELKKDVVYPFVYKLIKLTLTLPVEPATVERVFSAMKVVKSRLQDRMGDDWLSDCLVTYIERDIFDTIDNERIMQRFQNMNSQHIVE
ncbi:Dimer_Tnp_hAT domain-containing protein/DUF4371 domain-containing protein [Cephalotus follicularis]|uniref:Dimer_Tnp_hAT domain-containing protein/DUF4371 domain-containing protein n=1 Tax=Cephalotus follicularis TaxID=3775 RepID=A0A1Q3BEB3_CEPFO|nr:Dimer_Tnp_hAT domain-containing protein/DUF4371 domain-containing protein [Cephalotus follicularis]